MAAVEAREEEASPLEACRRTPQEAREEEGERLPEHGGARTVHQPASVKKGGGDMVGRCWEACGTGKREEEERRRRGGGEEEERRRKTVRDRYREVRREDEEEDGRQERQGRSDGSSWVAAESGHARMGRSVPRLL
eukprot:747591-Hanusia_phi.AAC.3